MEIALICVSGVHAFVKWRKQIPVGIAGAKVRFQFDDPCWEGLTKTIVFQGAETKDVILDGDSCELPQEVVSRIGASVRVGVYGTDSDNNIAIPTLWAHIGIVQDAADPSGDPATDPSLPIWAQLQQEIENLKDTGGVNVSGAVPGQMIVVKKVNENGIPTEWEPVDRTHWVEEGGMTELIPETTLTPDEDGTAVITTEVPNLVAGDTYTVNWNGVEYNCVAQEIATEDIAGNTIGNIGAVTGGTDTGEPFVILRISDDFVASAGIYAIIFVLDGSTSVTLSIYGKGETIHKLDNKFLDLAWLPVLAEKCRVQKKIIANGDLSYMEYTSKLDGFGMESGLYVGQKFVVYFDSIPYIVEISSFGSGLDELLLMGNLGLNNDVYPDTGEPFVITLFNHYSLISWLDGEESHTVSVYELAPNKMPEEYLPESVGGIVVRSSTEGSTKKFHLTIDDNGAVAITEIT